MAAAWGAAADLLGDALGRTSNDAIIFFVVLAASLALLLFPLYRLHSKHRLDQLKHSMELEAQRSEIEAARSRDIMTVVTANTEAMHQLRGCIARMEAKLDAMQRTA